MKGTIIAGALIAFSAAGSGAAIYALSQSQDDKPAGQRVAPASPSKAMSVAAVKANSAPVLDAVHAEWLALAMDAHGALDNGLPDYPSTRFRSVHGIVYLPGKNASNYVLCGDLNTKNRMNAYSGWEEFAVSYSSTGKTVYAYLSNTDNGTFIVEGLCGGQGYAQARRIAANQAREQRIESGEETLSSDELMDEIRNLKNVKPDQVLPHRVDRVTDYANQIRWTAN